MDSRAAFDRSGFSRMFRLTAIAIAGAICATLLLSAGEVRAEPLCETPGSTAPIGPHDSTPEQYRGTGTGVPVSVGSLWDWSGPCGTTDRTADSQGNWDYKNWDYYYLEIEEDLDLALRIKPVDPADRFVVTLFRGWIPLGDRQFRPTCSERVEPPCAVASGDNLIPSPTGEIALTTAQIPAGTYTIRVNYAVVVEGSYRGRLVASSADEGEQGSEELEPEPESSEPRVRGKYPENPNDPLFGDQWGMSTIRAPKAWQVPHATGFGITIAVVDTGVDRLHPDLSCPGKLALVEGANRVEGGPPQDDDGHGTHVAGIAAACSNNRTGVVGVAPDAAVMPVRVDLAADNLENVSPGGAAMDDIMADGIRFATKHGAHVINLSIGPFVPPDMWSPELHDDTEDALQDARAAGVVVVSSAGNFYKSPPSPFCGYPALSESVICVGATDRRDNVAWYSYLPNKFDTSSGGIESDMTVVAPGGAGIYCTRDIREGIVSTVLRTAKGTCDGYEDGYQEMDGTSMASPHVAGVAALVYDRLGGERNRENADAVINAITSTAKDLYADGYDAFSGNGRVDAFDAVMSIKLPEEEEKVVDPTPDPDPTEDTNPDPDPSNDPTPQPEPSQEPTPEPEPSESVVLPHTVVLSPRDVKGEVGADSEVVLTVTDVEGNPMAGAAVEWASIGVGRIVDAAAHTDEAGRATATLISDEPGDQHVMAWTSSCGDGGDCVDEAIRHHGPVRCDVFGTLGDDWLRGTDADDVICAFGGSDVLIDGTGNDTLYGGAGSDALYGGSGGDRMFGQRGDDELRGGNGPDLLVGGRGFDRAWGGGGRDVCRVSQKEHAKSCRR